MPMKIDAIAPLRPVAAPTVEPREPAARNQAFDGERGKSLEALRKAVDKGVGAEHKQAHSRRFGALLDEEA